MRKILALASLMFALSGMSLAWNCTTPGQIRVQVPTGTVGTGTGDGSGQVVVDNGLTFQCQTPPTPSIPTGNPVSSTSTSTASSASNSNSTSGSNSSATGGNSSSTANGGNSSSTSQGGSVSGSGNSTSTSGVKNSGNSSNTNNNTAQGGQGGSASQTQSQSTTSNATGNGDNANNSTEITNIKPASASAIAPVGFPTAPCLGNFGAGVQSIPGGISFGGSHVDAGCDSRQTALQFAITLNNRLAAAKILCSTKAAKRAKLTLDDCLAFVVPPAPVTPPVVIASPVLQPQPTVTIVQVPVPIILHDEITVTATPAQVRAAQVPAKKPVVHKAKPCIVPQSLSQPMEK